MFRIINPWNIVNTNLHIQNITTVWHWHKHHMYRQGLLVGLVWLFTCIWLLLFYTPPPLDIPRKKFDDSQLSACLDQAPAIDLLGRMSIADVPPRVKCSNKYALYNWDPWWKGGYHENCGGCMAMYNFAWRLRNAGCTVVMVRGTGVNPWNISTVEQLPYNSSSSNNYVGIYNEVPRGNPMNVTRIVRWLQYYPGVWGGPTSFSPKERIFYFQRHFSTGIGSPSLGGPVVSPHNQYWLRTLDYGLNIVPHITATAAAAAHNNVSIFMIHKANLVWTQQALINKVNELRSMHPGREFKEISAKAGRAVFCKACATFRHDFYCFDHKTYYVVLAAICGCTPILILPPQKNITRVQVIESYPALQYGVAFDDSERNHAKATRLKLLHYIECDDKLDNILVRNFIVQTHALAAAVVET